ncbi:hypothetical protein N0B31_13985 [Salinirubellus salinus]|uniref:Uncharacterized protein n=1 Tax=Salinirubellus salinus TaxID=1364945 RepID=A0A9E7R090_9EURY|nr:hypothetical protein [Salinirubellus salinus]UWM53247.1 hypothetical protein N0B31_13985 [Salinirubellus salinus]
MRWLVVTLVLVLAGCGGYGAPTADPRTTTVTPAPVPAATPAPSATTLAPGLGTGGVFDAGRLAAAHADALAGRSFTLNRTDSRYVNGTLSQRDTSLLQYATGRERFRYDLRQTDRRGGANATSRIERYADGERVFVAVTRGNETRYDLLRSSDGSASAPTLVFPENATNERGIARLFVLIDTEVTGERTVDGRSVYRLASPSPQTVPPLRNISFVANVTETGLVRDYRVSYDVVRSGRQVRVVTHTSYRGVGETTVPEPPWLGRAEAALRNGTDTSTLTRRDGGVLSAVPDA